MIKKDLVIAVLATFCLTATLFVVIPIGGLPVYDPWIDLNDDGVIDGQDFQMVKGSIPSLGEPINKTALLYNVNDTLTALLSRIDSLNASLLDLEAYFETRINTLNATLVEQQSRISDLETQLIILNATKLGKPDYDSGGLSVPAGESRILTHGLNTTNVIVYMVGYDFNGQEFHQMDYGGEKSSIYNWGACWSELTTTTIKVTRYGSDFVWDVIRVMVWKIPEP